MEFKHTPPVFDYRALRLAMGIIALAIGWLPYLFVAGAIAAGWWSTLGDSSSANVPIRAWRWSPAAGFPPRAALPAISAVT